MADSFLGGVKNHLLFWLGWVFTVGGAVASLWVVREYPLIGVLFLLGGLCALTGFAYEKHRELRDARNQHREREGQLEAAVQAERERADNAERRLTEVPADRLQQWERFIQIALQSHAFEALAAELVDFADYIGRMGLLMQATARQIPLRNFEKRGSVLYAQAKMNESLIAHLREEDAFTLEYKNPEGLTTTSASLRVHQLEVSKGLVWFRVVSSSGEEMEPLEALADKQLVKIRGYTVRPACDLSRYSGLSLTGIATVLETLVEDVQRLRG